MITQLARVTILVKNQEEALKFYTEKLGLEKRDDRTMGPGMRWLTIAPKGQKEVEIVLLRAGTGCKNADEEKEQQRQVGKGTPWVFFTDDCGKDYEALRARGVDFVRPPTKMPFGTEALFEDLYGNRFSLVQRP